MQWSEGLSAANQTDRPAEDSRPLSRNLFENAPVGLWEVDATGIIVAINQTLLRRVACTRADVVDRQTLEALVSPESTPTVQEVSERCRQDGVLLGSCSSGAVRATTHTG